MHCGLPLCLAMPAESVRILVSLVFIIVSLVAIVGLAYILTS
jgi:hypothetical protein